MTRLLASVALSLLLLGLQHRLVAHEIEHLGARLHHGPHATLQVADGGVCLECALLAGTSSAVPLDDAHAAFGPERAAPPAVPAHPAPRRFSSSPYLSRAPPLA